MIRINASCNFARNENVTIDKEIHACISYGIYLFRFSSLVIPVLSLHQTSHVELPLHTLLEHPGTGERTIIFAVPSAVHLQLQQPLSTPPPLELFDKMKLYITYAVTFFYFARRSEVSNTLYWSCFVWDYFYSFNYFRLYTNICNNKLRRS